MSDGIWSSPGSHAKLYENEDIVLKWYSDTKWIILCGKLTKEFEEKLNSMASISQELKNKDLPFASRTDKAVVGLQTAISGWDYSPEAFLKHLESRLLQLSEDFLANTLAVNNTLLDHSKQLNGLKNQDKDKLSALEKENHELKVENSALEERKNNLSYILADLQGKVKHAEEQKASLITAIRLPNNNSMPNDRILVTAEDETTEPTASEKADAFAALVQCLDDRSLSLVMRKAKVLRQHYEGKGKPRVIALYTELTTLKKANNEATVDYCVRAETARQLYDPLKK